MDKNIRDRIRKSEVLREPKRVDTRKKDIEILDRGAQELLHNISALVDTQEWLKVIHEIWRRPGWTTPAERLFAEAALRSLNSQAAELQRGLSDLRKGVGLVGGGR